jgi:hypothetical protein
MASPVSIGDALLIGGLAYRLGCAFTSGRKSAPREFQEVENQLYSLSAALGLLDNGRTMDSDGYALDMNPSSALYLQTGGNYNGDNVLGLMIQNCEETLKHLESIVEKYTTIRPVSGPTEPRAENNGTHKSPRRKWQRDIKRNWKQIKWTAKGGDLATLRSQLTIHMNSLSLVVGVINKYLPLPVSDSAT